MLRSTFATFVALCFFFVSSNASLVDDAANPSGYKQATPTDSVVAAATTPAPDRLICTGSSGASKLCPLGIYYGQCCSGIDFCCPRTHDCNPDGSATCVKKPSPSPVATKTRPLRPQHQLTVIRNNNQLYDGPKFQGRPRRRNWGRGRRGRGRRSESSEGSEGSEGSEASEASESSLPK